MVKLVSLALGGTSANNAGNARQNMNVVHSLDLVTANAETGDIDLIAGPNIAITTDMVNNTITITAGEVGDFAGIDFLAVIGDTMIGNIGINANALVTSLALFVAGNTDTGIFSPDHSELSFVSNGEVMINYHDSYVTITNAIAMVGVETAANVFNGIYRETDNSIAVAVEGLMRFTVNAASNSAAFVNLDGSLLLPVGNVLERPTDAISGEIRYNDDNEEFEGFAIDTWAPFGSGSGGGGSGSSQIPPFRGVLVTRTSNQAISNVTSTLVNWENEVYDTDDFFNISTPSRLDIPVNSPVLRVMVYAQIRWDSINASDNEFQVNILKNGTSVDGLGGNFLQGLDGNSLRELVMSAPITVAPGDQFEIEVFQNSPLTVNVRFDTRTWFGLMAVETTSSGDGVGRFPFQGALVTANSEIEILDDKKGNVTWGQDNVEYDVGGFFSNVSPNVFTVPSGVTRVRLTGGVEWEGNSAGIRRLHVEKNGEAFPGCPIDTVFPDDTEALYQSIETPTITVVAGDTFALMANHSVGSTINVVQGNSTFFAIEAIETIETQPYDVSFYLPGSYLAAQLAVQHIAVRTFTMLEDAVGSQGFAAVTATANANYVIQRNESNIGNIFFETATSAAVFESVQTVFSPGDRLNIISPAPADNTLENVSITFKMVR